MGLAPVDDAIDVEHWTRMEECRRGLLERQVGLQRSYAEVRGSLQTLLGTQTFLEGTVAALQAQGEALRGGLEDNRVVMRGLAGASKEEDASTVAGWHERVVHLEAENARLTAQLEELSHFATELSDDLARWTQERGVAVETSPEGKAPG